VRCTIAATSLCEAYGSISRKDDLPMQAEILLTRRRLAVGSEGADPGPSKTTAHLVRSGARLIGSQWAHHFSDVCARPTTLASVRNLHAPEINGSGVRRLITPEVNEPHPRSPFGLLVSVSFRWQFYPSAQLWNS
jgi:hypothetical protein